MKKILLCAMLMMTGFGGLAQTDSVYVWNKWCARRDTLLLFAGSYNTIQVYCRGLRPDDIKVKSLDNALRIGKPEVKGDTTSLMAMPYPAKTKNKSMRLAITYKKTGKTIKTVNFNCDEVPQLVARVGRIQGTDVPKKDLLAQTVINAVYPNSLYCYPYKIKQYTVKIATPSGGITINAAGHILPKEIFPEINNAPAGTILEFTNIKATCPECVTHSLPDLRLKIR